ncbi:putative E3 ubiquitin-protein ligase UBR7 [Pseudolycoriella hygida]|uniref:Putative E3 ubiquitin-protein ligase UBR7 n=1 Tax=Pseudolycoriella hygida TaxID=35572 RepID=A0A9Q0NGC2_9DIPT|nr:putative E3 ubiquitin-protein ligase UBR7 [Pseudolycoriella hygida]
MSENDINQEGASTSENRGEDEVTLEELLRQQKELDEEYEQEYKEILGGSDDKLCTYPQGYVKRQALYACLTCTPEARTDPTKRAGVCLACSYNCHDGHDMVELYTKRNFRCDCGTAKILAVQCKLESVKLDQNEKNVYNQNFSGVYCKCQRPYPDPEDSVEDEMIQCIICEDWYHSRHLATTVPKSTSFAEMICGDCMAQNDILLHYVGFAITKVEDSDLSVCVDQDASMNATGTLETTLDEPSKPEEGKVEESLKDEINQSIMNILEINKNNSEANDEQDSEPQSKRRKFETETKCTKPLLVGDKLPGATFWQLDWRKNICSCQNCVAELKATKLEYLLDLEDTVWSYQEKGMAKVHETSEERAMRAFSQIDRQKQINVLTGYNKLKESLKEFLHSYAVSDVAVTIDDVNRFFRMMNEKDDK